MIYLKVPKPSDGQQNTENQKALPDVVGSKKQVSYRTEIIGGVPIVTPTQVTPSAVLYIYIDTWNRSYHYDKPVIWCMISNVKPHCVHVVCHSAWRQRLCGESRRWSFAALPQPAAIFPGPSSSGSCCHQVGLLRQTGSCGEFLYLQHAGLPGFI